MLILHFSHTPLVGAPGRICAALNSKPGVESRWVVLNGIAGSYSRMEFSLDLLWSRDKDEVLELLNRCDVIHLHNYLHLGSEEFSPINFRTQAQQGKSILRQFHSAPEFIARFLGATVQDVLECPLPRLVIAQFHERYYPTARVVPNLVTIADSVVAHSRDRLRIGYAPTRFNSASDSRWDSKGYPETRRMLASLKRSCRRRGIEIDIDIIELVSHQECMRRKANCDIFIDDLVTGSYHLNTLEALAEGVACICYLDQRTERTIAALTGSLDFPVINVGLENALEVLLTLCESPELIRNLGVQSKVWMKKNWEPEQMADHFISAYKDVIRNPAIIFDTRIEKNSLDSWRATDLQDAIWRSRSRQWPRNPPSWFLRWRSKIATLARNFRLKFEQIK